MDRLIARVYDRFGPLPPPAWSDELPSEGTDTVTATRFPSSLARLLTTLGEAIRVRRSREGAHVMLSLPAESAQSPLRDILLEWDVPLSETFLMFSAPPRATGVSRLRLEQSRLYSTLGRPVVLPDGKPGLTTVGHLIPIGDKETLPRSGWKVAVESKRRLGSRKRRDIGTVDFSCDPLDETPHSPSSILDGAGVDVAVIRPSVGLPALSPASLAAPSEVIEWKTHVEIRGAASGIRRGYVVGPLRVIEDEEHRVWMNSWSVSGLDRGLAREGDSGSPAVVTGSGDCLGFIVGRAGSQTSGGSYQFGIVQDIHTVVARLEGEYGGRISVLEDLPEGWPFD